MVQDKAANEVLRLFTAFFTARDAGVPMGSAAGCGPFLTCFRSHERLYDETPGLLCPFPASLCWASSWDPPSVVRQLQGGALLVDAGPHAEA